MTRRTKKRAPKKLTRKQRSHLEREQRVERIILWGVALVAIAVVGVLGYGLVVEKIIKERQPVAVVGSTPITTSEFRARVRFLRLRMNNQIASLNQQRQMIDPEDSNAEAYLQYIQQQIASIESRLAPENAETMGEEALNQLIQEELVRQEVESRGITVTPEEVQEKIEVSFGYDPDATLEPAASPPLTSTATLTTAPEATPRPTPTRMTEADFRQMYNRSMREVLNPLGVSEKMYRSWIEAELLTEKLREDMETELPSEAEQVELYLFSASSEERANELAAQLDATEDFQALADELEEDDTAYANELGWSSREVLESWLGEALADKAFSLEVGEHSQPTLAQEGQRYTIIQVTGREERELDEFARQQMAESAFQDWLEAQQVLVERREYQDRVPTEP